MGIDRLHSMKQSLEEDYDADFMEYHKDDVLELISYVLDQEKRAVPVFNELELTILENILWNESQKQNHQDDFTKIDEKKYDATFDMLRTKLGFKF